AEFIQIENNVVQFSVPYDFHREKLMEKITKEKIELILSNLFGSIVLIHITTKTPVDEHTQNPELQSLAIALGGQVI
ncbi:MAG: hypothetical protein HYV41_01125, partial [Candidatus Magasanikbacteria bacterium]|nr:hypothetical protein [Candidatus Magasanikbacteria bacterium]